MLKIFGVFYYSAPITVSTGTGPSTSRAINHTTINHFIPIKN